MGEDQLLHEIKELENWFNRFSDPKPSGRCVARTKRSTAAELQRQLSDGVESAVAPAELKQSVKAAVRRELQRSAVRGNRWAGPWAIRIYSRLAAALLLLAVGISLLMTTFDRNEVEDMPFEIELAMLPELSDIDVQITEIELKTHALDYWLASSGEEPMEFQEQIENLVTPEYQMNFADQSDYEGDL